MRVYYDRDADLNLIKTKKVAIIGYGSQGFGHANNMRDSGVKDVAVALRPGSGSAKKAEAAGFKVMDVTEAARWADVMMMLTPDELQGAIYRDHLQGNMKEGAALDAPPKPTTDGAEPMRCPGGKILVTRSTGRPTWSATLRTTPTSQRKLFHNSMWGRGRSAVDLLCVPDLRVHTTMNFLHTPARRWGCQRTNGRSR